MTRVPTDFREPTEDERLVYNWAIGRWGFCALWSVDGGIISLEGVAVTVKKILQALDEFLDRPATPDECRAALGPIIYGIAFEACGDLVWWRSTAAKDCLEDLHRWAS